MLQRAEGIILRTVPYGDADLIVTYFTREAGLVQGFAKSARKFRSRFGASLEPLTHVRLSLLGREGASLPRVTQSDILDSFQGLRDDLPTLTALGPVVDMALYLLHEREPHPRKFDLLLAGFQALLATSRKEPIRLALIVKFLWMSGYGPRTSVCGRCGALFSGEYGLFFPDQGAMLCEHCRAGNTGQTAGQTGQAVRPILFSRDAATFLSQAKALTFAELLPLEPGIPVLADVRRLVDGHLIHVAGIRILRDPRGA